MLFFRILVDSISSKTSFLMVVDLEFLSMEMVYFLFSLSLFTFILRLRILKKVEEIMLVCSNEKNFIKISKSDDRISSI